MSKEKLADLLRQLHDELAKADDLDEQLNEQLRAATEEIDEVLERDELAEQPVEKPHGLIEQLRQAADRFEDSHPTLTNTVGRVADALSQLGI